MNIVVVGAGAGGLAAATRAQRANPDARVQVVEKTREFSRGTCSLPYYLSGEIKDASRLQGVTDLELKNKGVELLLETEALKIQVHQRKLETSRDTLGYDRLIVSTGSKPRGIKTGFEAEDAGIWQIRTLAQVERIRHQLKERPHRKVAVVGGGYVGLEFAEALHQLGLEVTLFHRGSHLMKLHPVLSDAVGCLLGRHQIGLELDKEVEEVKRMGQNLIVETKCGQTFPFDAVALATGVKPEVTLLKDAGARLGSTGGVRVNTRGETSLSNVYACGDGVELPNPEGGPGRWIPLATTAARLGRVCGENASGRGGRRLGSHFGALAVRLFGNQLGVVGQQADWQDCTEHIFHWGQDGHPFPSRQPGVGALFVERGTERLRGLQALGPDAGHLVNLLSLACEKGLTIEDLQDLDYSYNPPLSGLWHPFYLAARQAERDKISQPGGIF